MNGSRDVLPLVFGLDVVGNKKGALKRCCSKAVRRRVRISSAMQNLMSFAENRRQGLFSFESLAVSCGAVSARLRLEGLQTYKKHNHHNNYNSNN